MDNQHEITTTPMDPEVKAQWVAALRSGEYEQGTHALRRGNKFCCLGVLCDLAVRAGVEVEVGEDPRQMPEPFDALITYDDHTALTPRSVNVWAGLPEDPLRIGGPGGDMTLTALNDNGATFSELADLIEAKL